MGKDLVSMNMRILTILYSLPIKNWMMMKSWLCSRNERPPHLFTRKFETPDLHWCVQILGRLFHSPTNFEIIVNPTITLSVATGSTLTWCVFTYTIFGKDGTIVISPDRCVEVQGCEGEVPQTWEAGEDSVRVYTLVALVLLFSESHAPSPLPATLTHL